MHPEMKALIEKAQEQYLKSDDLLGFRRHVASLAQRLQAYKVLRDREEEIFQPIADTLVEAFPNESQETLERSLKYWLSAMRHCAAAMLASDSNYLNTRLQWLTGLMGARDTHEIDSKIEALLRDRVAATLSQKQLAVFEPYLKKACQQLSKVGADDRA
ncbi:phycobilisome protein [Oxynema sp. CENA135]|uniref:phycobilisome protein n=1 Tax=Oxynema sp. CENA135 TaxID=984206 RepID=UPI00190A1E7A|nr:phycobilisome protein [Oxynema sp. CENA135]MBK4732530.1 phycobilisome protein [Oxynema sp. CENA135]